MNPRPRHYEKWAGDNSPSQPHEPHYVECASERHARTACDTLDSSAGSSASERSDVHVIPVTLVAESTASACGCADPKLHWSDVYARGDTARRVYFFCVSCQTFGFLALPESTWAYPCFLRGISQHQLRMEAEAEFSLLPDLPDLAGVFIRAAEQVFTRRERCASLHLETIRKAVVEEATALFSARAKEILAEREAALASEHFRIGELRARLDDELRRARRDRKRSADRSLNRRKPVARSKFPVVARGEHHSGAVIYGLIDPREPERIRYVGQAKSAGSRLASHISGSARPTSKKDRWIAQLVSEGAYPDMVMLERAKPDADVDALERWWIAQMVTKGQADMNTASVPKAPVAVDGAIS